MSEEQTIHPTIGHCNFPEQVLVSKSNTYPSLQTLHWSVVPTSQVLQFATLHVLIKLLRHSVQCVSWPTKAKGQPEYPSAQVSHSLGLLALHLAQFAILHVVQEALFKSHGHFRNDPLQLLASSVYPNEAQSGAVLQAATATPEETNAILATKIILLFILILYLLKSYCAIMSSSIVHLKHRYASDEEQHWCLTTPQLSVHGFDP